MTQYTDIAGNVNATKTLVFCYGPYLMKVPVNQFNDKTTVGVDGTAGDNSDGWNLISTTGLLQADDSAAHAAL